MRPRMCAILSSIAPATTDSCTARQAPAADAVQAGNGAAGGGGILPAGEQSSPLGRLPNGAGGGASPLGRLTKASLSSLNGIRTGLWRLQKEEESAGAQEVRLNSHETQPNGEVAGHKHSEEPAGGEERGAADVRESTQGEETAAAANTRTAAPAEAAQCRGHVQEGEAKQREAQAEAAGRQAQEAVVAPALPSKNQEGRDEERAATHVGVAVAEKTAEVASEAQVPTEIVLDVEGEVAKHKEKGLVGEVVAQNGKEATVGENSFVAEYRDLRVKEEATVGETGTGEGAIGAGRAEAEAAPTAQTAGKVSRFSSMLEMGKKAASLAKQVRICLCPSLSASVCLCLSVCLWLSPTATSSVSKRKGYHPPYVALHWECPPSRKRHGPRSAASPGSPPTDAKALTRQPPAQAWTHTHTHAASLEQHAVTRQLEIVAQAVVVRSA